MAAEKMLLNNETIVRIIKEWLEKTNSFFSLFLSQMFNFYIDNNAYPNEFWKAGNDPVNKKDSHFLKKLITGQLVSCQFYPELSNVVWQIYEYVNNILSKTQCGFRKGFSKQY